MNNSKIFTPSLEGIKEVHVSKEVQTERPSTTFRKLKLKSNDFTSTPPSVLRKVISNLQDELHEAYEFHDLELEILKEEKQAIDKNEETSDKLLELTRSLKDAKNEIVDAKKEIDSLQMLNQDLSEKLKEESNQNLTLKEQFESQISDLQQNLKKAKCEIESLKQEKNDFDYKMEMLNKNYTAKISELTHALEMSNEKERESETAVELIKAELENKLADESERANLLSKELEELRQRLLISDKQLLGLKVKNVDDNLIRVAETQTDEDALCNDSPEKYVAELRCLKKEIETLRVVRVNEINELKLKNESLRTTNLIITDELKAANETIQNQILELTDLRIHNASSLSYLQPLKDNIVQTDEEPVNLRFEEKLSEIRSTYEKEIKTLKNDHNDKLKDLELRNENLQKTNSTTNGNVKVVNEILEGFEKKIGDEKSPQKTENNQVSELQNFEEELLKPQNTLRVANGDSERKRTSVISCEEVNDTQQELQGRRDFFGEEIIKVDNESQTDVLAENHDCDWKQKCENLKSEKEAITLEKEETLFAVLSDLEIAREKLRVSETALAEYAKERASYADEWNLEKEKWLQWIQSKEEEYSSLKDIVEAEVVKLKSDSKNDLSDLKTFYETQINNLVNANAKLCQEINLVKIMYEAEPTEDLKLAECAKMTQSEESLAPSETVKKDSSRISVESSEIQNCGETLDLEKVKIKDEFREDVCDHQVDNSVFMNDNLKIDNSIFSEISKSQCDVETTLSLPIDYNCQDRKGFIWNYQVHTLDQENMQLKINTEFKMMEFLTEFTNILLKENIVNPEELKTCSNIFCSLLNKHLDLIEMYSDLKIDFDEYRLYQEKKNYDIVNKTVNCLDTLCYQLQVSEGTLNLSNSSYISFKEDLPSSTIIEDANEIEITMPNDVTLMTQDPLALTQDFAAQTQFKTPLRSCVKFQENEFKTPLSISKALKTPLKMFGSVKKRVSKVSKCPESRELQRSKKERDAEAHDLLSEYEKLIGNSEEIKRTLHNFAALEERISKLEKISAGHQNEREKLARENESLQQQLSKKLEEMASIKERLMIEITSLNPEFKGSMADDSLRHVLSAFMNTIMESCNTIPEQLSEKWLTEIKTLNEKIENYEEQMFGSSEELDKLKEANCALVADNAAANKTISECREEIGKLQMETTELKSKVEDLKVRLRENEDVLKTETLLRESALGDLERIKTIFEDVEKENSELKAKIDESNVKISELKMDLIVANKAQTNFDGKVKELMEEITQLKSALTSANEKNNGLQNSVDILESQIKTIESDKNCEISLLNAKISETQNVSEQRLIAISELKEKLLQSEKQINMGLQDFSELNEKIKILSDDLISSEEKCKRFQKEVEELTEALDNYRETNKCLTTDKEEQTRKLSSLEAELVLKTEDLKKVSSRMEEVDEYKVTSEETISNLKEKVVQLKNETNSVLMKSRETEMRMADEISTLSLKYTVSQTELATQMKGIQEISSQLQSVRETISLMKVQIDELKNEKIKLEEAELIIERYRESENLMTREIESLNSKLFQNETELIENEELVVKLSAELKKSQEIIDKDKEVISVLELRIDDLNNDKLVLESLESTLEKCKSSERAKSDELEKLKEELGLIKTDLIAKVEMLDRLSEEAEKSKADSEQTESGLRFEVEELRIQVSKLKGVKELLETANHEKDTLFERLNGFLTTEDTLKSEIDALRKKLLEAEDTVKSQVEKLAKLEEIKSELTISKELVNQLQSDSNDIMSKLAKVTAESEVIKAKNIEYENVNAQLLEKLQTYEDQNSLSSNEIALLKENLLTSESCLKLAETERNKLLVEIETIESNLVEREKVVEKLKLQMNDLKELQAKHISECERLENEKMNLIQELEDSREQSKCLISVLQDVENKLNLPRRTESDVKTGMSEWRKLIIDKLNDLFKIHSEEVEKFKLNLANLKESNDNLQTEIGKLTNKITEGCKCLKDDSLLEQSFSSKSGYMTRRNKARDNPSFISRRLEKLENLNDLLSGTVRKIVDTLGIPVSDNLFSVGRYDTYEEQVMKYVTDLKLLKKDTNRGDEAEKVSSGWASEKIEELERTVSKLQTILGNVTNHLGLPDGVVSSQEILNQIDKNVDGVRNDLLTRIDVLRKDNQCLDNDNNLLQQELKKLIEKNGVNEIKLSGFEKSEEMLRAEISKLQLRNKSRKSDVCQRRLEKLEELNQALAELVTKILTLIEVENVDKYNLFTIRTFDIARKEILHEVASFVNSKLTKIQQLEANIQELNEDYSDAMRNARHKLHKCTAKCQDKKSELKKQWSSKDLEFERLNEENKILQSRIDKMEQDLAQSKNQVKELDEECNSYAEVIKDAETKTVKVWEDGQQQIEALKLEIKELKQGNESLECEKKVLSNKVQGLVEEQKKLKTQKMESDSSEFCQSGNEREMISKLRNTIISREMKILELEQLNEKLITHKSQMSHLESALSLSKKQLTEEKEKTKKLATQLEEFAKNSKLKGFDENFMSNNAEAFDFVGLSKIQSTQEGGRLQKLEKDNRMLKELCRSHFNEIKRLEKENLLLKGHEKMTKNSNQMDSPIRVRCYNTRSKKMANTYSGV